jgi:AraC family transcriptional regulator of arabinose operon
VREALSVSDLSIELRPVRVSVGTVVYPPGGRLGPRLQGDLQLLLLHAGSVRIRVDDEAPRRLGPGRVRLLLPGHRERFAFDEVQETRHAWVQAHVPELPAEALQRMRRLPAELPLSPALDALVREAVGTAATALPTSAPIVAHLAVAALWRFVGEAERQAPERTRPVDDAERFIDRHLGSSALTLDGIAEAAHVSRAHLIRSFKRVHGITPMAYVWRRRVALAADLLGSTGLPLAAVAERCGFRTEQHFSRRVKQATGMAPGALRRDRWSQ